MATNKKFNVRHGLSAGTGSTQKDIVSDAGLIYDVGLLSNLSTEAKTNTVAAINELAGAFYAKNEPMGLEDRTHSVISFSEGSRTFSIAPNTPTHSSYVVWNQGLKRVISTTKSVTIPNTTGLWYIYFDSNFDLQYKSGYFTWDEDTNVAYVYWNAATGKAPFVADERHGVSMDWATHEYLHRTRGTAIADGFSISVLNPSGTGSLDTDAQVNLGNGTFFDEDLEVYVSHSATPTTGTFTQILQGPAQIPAFYQSGAPGQWVEDAPTLYPAKTSATTLQYNLLSGGTWSTAAVTDGQYCVSWIVATNDINFPVLAILGQSDYATAGAAEASLFSDLVLSNFPIVEFRPLWKVVFQTSAAYANTPNARISNVLDIRRLETASGAGVAVSDHGLLSGLSDDDHYQYLHVSNTRTGVTAEFNTTSKITTTNRIGIGTTTPQYDLHIVGTTDPSGMFFDAYGTVAPNIAGRRANGAVGAPTVVNAGDNLLALTGSGYTGTEFSIARAIIFMKASETWTSTAQGSNIDFITTAPGTTNRSTRLRLDGYGNLLINSLVPTGTASQFLQVTGGAYISDNVGIGTTNPTGKLDVTGTDNTRIYIQNTGTGGAGFDIRKSDGSWAWRFTGEAEGFKVRDHLNSLDKFYIEDGATGNVWFNNIGNLGIGTTVPQGKLHAVVSGSRFVLETTSSELNSSFNLWNNSSSVSAGTGMIFSATTDLNQSNDLVFIGGIASQRIDSGVLNSRTALRVLSNGTLTDATSNATFYLEGTASGPRIIANANVGISSSAPTEKLDVVGNIKLTGELRGPASFVIDPAAVGDNTGTVIIRGSLQVDGTTTTINSTTLTVDDKNITLADGVSTLANLDTAGIDFGSTAVRLRYNYNSGTNSGLSIEGTSVGIGTTAPRTTLEVSGGTQQGIKIDASTGYPALWLSQAGTNIWSLTSNLNSDNAFVIRESDVADRLNIKPGGNVGIGTTNPGQKLDVVGNIQATGSVRVFSSFGNRFNYLRGDSSADYAAIGARTSSDTVNTDALVWTPAGNVGIGTTNPGAKLTVWGPITIGTNNAIDLGTTQAPFKLVNNNSALGGGGAIINELYSTATSSTPQPGYIARFARGTEASPLAVAAGDRLAFFVGGGYGTTQFHHSASIDIISEEAYTDSARGSYIRFTTTSVGQTARVEKLRITGAGRIGIGVIDPQSTLAVNGYITESTDGGVNYYNVVTQQDVGFNPNQIPLNQYLGQLAFMDEYSPSGLRRAGGGSDDLVVASSGNIGIGTASPSAQLHVYGPNFPLARIERNTSLTTGMRSTFSAIHTTSADMTDGFGADISFGIRDSAGVDNEIANFGAIRDGADNSGALVFATTLNGTQQGAIKMILKSTGNVGIGTTNPTWFTDIYTNVDSSGNNLRLSNASAGTLSCSILNLSAGGTNTYLFANSPNRAADGGASTATLRNDSGSLRLQSSGGIGLFVQATSGNVGVGTANPTDKLHVQGSAVFQSTYKTLVSGDGGRSIEIGVGNTSASAYIDFHTADDVDADNSARIDRGAGINGSLTLLNKGTGTISLFNGGSERLTVTSTGNIGVGTSNPGSRLQIGSSATTDTDYLKVTGTGNTSRYFRYVQIPAKATAAGVADTTKSLYVGRLFTGSTVLNVFTGGDYNEDGFEVLIYKSWGSSSVPIITYHFGNKVSGTDGRSFNFHYQAVGNDSYYLFISYSYHNSVPLGTSNSIRLDITSLSSQGSFTVGGTPTIPTLDSSNRLNYGLFVNESGKVGVGNNVTPSLAFDGYGSLRMSSGAPYESQIISRNDSNDTTAAYLVLEKTRAGAAVQNGDSLGTLLWRGMGTGGTIQNSFASIFALAEGTVGSGPIPAGMYLTASSKFVFDLGGEKVRIDSAGRVGIGSTQPLSLLTLGTNSPGLEFNDLDSAADNRRWQFYTTATTLGLRALTDAGSGGGNIFLFNRSAEQVQSFQGLQDGAAWFHVDNSTARVGVGSASPVSTLEVSANSTSTVDLTVTNSNTGNNITKASRLRFRLTDSVGTRKDVAFITAYTYNLDSSAGNYLSFATRTADATPTEKMRLDKDGNLTLGSAFTPTGTATQALQVNSGAYFSGNVGIGLTNPAYKAHILQNGDTLALETQDISGRATLKFLTNGNDWELGARSSSASPANAFYLYDNAASLYRLVVASNGNVGINTNNPVRQLHISAGGESNIVLENFSAGTDQKRSRIYHDSSNDFRISFVNDVFNNENYILWAKRGTGYTISQTLLNPAGGNVGIGTTNATQILDVNGVAQITANSGTLNLVGTDHTYIQWYPDGLAAGRKAYTGFPSAASNSYTIANQITGGDGHIVFDPGAGAAVLIDTTAATGTSGQSLQVNGGAYVSGNVGVGVTDPSAKLEVGGEPSQYGYAVRVRNNTHATSKRAAIAFGNSASHQILVDSGGSGTEDFTIYQANINKSPFKIEAATGNIHIGGLYPQFAPTALSVVGYISESTDGGTNYYNVVTQQDVGFNPNQIPLNQYLGQLAFMDAYSPSGLRKDGGGSDDVVVDSNGRVGIAITNPNGQLTVNSGPQWGAFNYCPNILVQGPRNNGIGILDSSNANPWWIGNGGGTLYFAQMPALGNTATAPTLPFAFTSTGNVGIGITNPSAKLHITTNSSSVIRIDTPSEGGAPLIVAANSNTVTPTNQFFVAHNLNEVNIGNARAGALTLHANNTERLRISSDGFIGIGTTNPSQRLTNYVNADGGLHTLTQNANTGVSAYAAIHINAGDANAYYFINSQNRTSDGGTRTATLRNDAGDLRLLAGGSVGITVKGTTGDVGIGVASPAYKLQVNGSFAATTKSFVIDHPTKPDHKLRYGSLEGPENGVYIRGRLKGTNTIELPEYWTELIDEDSITVNLTPIGTDPGVYSIIKIANNTVTVASTSGTIDCFFMVLAERKDVEKLVVEYESES